MNELFDYLWKVFGSLRVGVGVGTAFRNFWYLRNIVWSSEWQWSSAREIKIGVPW
jgi:hypothetical protein